MTMFSGRTWKEEHDELLKACLQAGMSYASAADTINRKFGTTFSRNSAIGRAQRKGYASTVPFAGNHSSRKPKKAKRERKPAAPPKPKAIPQPTITYEDAKLRCAEVAPMHLNLVDLKAHQCHWPFGTGPYTFCGRKKFPGSPYCEAHLVLSKGRGTPSERAAVHVLASHAA